MISCGHTEALMEVELEQRDDMYHRASLIQHHSLQLLSFKDIITEKYTGYKLILLTCE